MHPLAGRPAPADLLIDVARLERDYAERAPDPDDPAQRVSFGTSGHRGSPLDGTFTEAHILAITQAICDYRSAQGITGPLFLGKDTHAASAPAERTALEVLAGNGVRVIVPADGGFTPTPAISHAILGWNREERTGKREQGTGKGGPSTRSTGSGASGLADGIVITPSHNPPRDGGFKYNTPNGGPADTDATGWIQDRANALLKDGNRGVRRARTADGGSTDGDVGLARGDVGAMTDDVGAMTDDVRATRWVAPTRAPDIMGDYVADLGSVIDLDAIRTARVRIGVDPLGGASVAYWTAIGDRHGLDITIVNRSVDPRFGFMTVDHDGKIRMDCSSPPAMAGLVGLRDRFDIACGNDPDADRHGIVTPSAGLLNPNHYLAVVIHYLLAHRPDWPKTAAVGKTLVSSAMIDRVAADLGRRVMEVPVGFKWFTPGLFDGTVCFGGEESAGASFLRRNGTVWTTDKDGILLGLLAAEITAVTGTDPGQLYAALAARLGGPVYTRIDTPCSAEEKAGFRRLTPEAVTATTLAGDAITARLTRAPGNGAPIGGLKVTTADGWFAARPSGTENVYKIYAESFRDAAHLSRIIEEARAMVGKAVT